MSNDKKDHMLILLIRWLARIISISFIGLLALFFIGEGNINEFMHLSTNEILLMLFVPILFTIGGIISWKRELLGGILILASVIGFNIVDIIASKRFTGEIEFAFIIVPGVLFILAGKYCNNKNQ